MNSRRITGFAPWVVIAVAAVLTWRFERSREATRSRISELADGIAAAKSKRDLLNSRLEQAEGLRSKIKADTGGVPTVAKTRGADGGNWLAELGSDPQLQNRYLAYLRSKFAMKYGSLYRQLGLTPEQIATFEGNLALRQEVYMDLPEALRSQGLSEGEPAAAELQAQLLEPYSAAQRELLGDQGLSQLDSYDQGSHWKTMATDFAGAATVAGIPLTPAQVQQLSSVAVQASQSSSVAQQAGGDASYWASVDGQAGSFLTPAQLDLMKSGEFLGPFGEGSRFQNQLADAIIHADRTDAAVTITTGGVAK